MELIKQWALGITISAIVGSVVLILSPRGGTEKIVRTAVSLFLLCAIFTPFLSGIDVDSILNSVTVEATEPDTSGMKDGVAKQTELVIREKISEILASNGINAKEINIDISIDEENKMTVNSVLIQIKSTDAKSTSKVKEAIKSQLGIDADFEVIG